MTESFLAVDWGTTNRRCYRIDRGGRMEATERDDHGILAIAPHDYPLEVAALRERFGDLPVICAGMVGSNRGWIEAGYVDCPATLEMLAARLIWAEPGRTAIVPGVARRSRTRPDVMRGEEVQFLGAVSLGQVGDDALLCQPGTHCKWARVTGGAIVDFTTAITGELFALLRGHSLLASQLSGAVEANTTFIEGVREGARRDLAVSLFGIRAGGLLGLRDDTNAAAYASGLVIGADVAARLMEGPANVEILADPELGGLYAVAVEELGGRARLHDSHAAFTAGITALWSMIQ